MTPRSALFAPSSMAQVDAATVAAGTNALTLMERAGAAVVRVIRGRWSRRPVAILAGPGQNGGDGWVIAGQLRAAGWPVALFTDWPSGALTGAAAEAAARSGIVPLPLQAFDGLAGGVVVDALFGAGLSRPVEGPAALALDRTWGAEVVAVDLPSGLCGATGARLGQAVPAIVTVTFHRKKLGHVLGEGPSLCGDLYVADIGLVGGVAPDAHENHPSLWQSALPVPPRAAHKYARGGVVVLGGPRHGGGAARLAAVSAAHAGAGAVTIAAKKSALDIYAARVDAIMLSASDNPEDVSQLIAGNRCAAWIAGPGLHFDPETEGVLRTLLALKKAVVLDASALSHFAGRSDELAALLPPRAVLTPHEGEFARLFPDVQGDALARARSAAARMGRTVLLKGATTVIATPGEEPVLNTHASPNLATAGSGDVLAGIIAAFLAQGMSPHLAAAAGAWVHGEAGRRGSAGLTADDLPHYLAASLTTAWAK